MNFSRRNWFLSTGGIFAASLIPTKAYSFLWNNPMRDDSFWLSRQQGIIEGGEYIIRSYCVLKPEAVLNKCVINLMDKGILTFHQLKILVRMGFI